MRRGRGRGASDAAQRRLSPDELRALAVAARAVNDASGVRETLERILDEAVGLLDADEGSVLLLDERGRHLRFAAARGVPPDVVERTVITKGEGVAGRVAARGEPALVGADDPPGDHEHARPLRSAICVPLEASGRVQGVLCMHVLADNDEHPGFDEHDLALASVFGAHAAATVGAHRLLDDAERRRRDLQTLYELGRGLAGAADEEAVGAAVSEAAVAATGASGVALAVLDGRRWRLAGIEGLHRGRVVAALRRAGEDWAPVEPTLVTDLEDDPVLAPLAADPAAVAQVTPLNADDAVIGVLLSVHPRTPRQRTHDQLVALADQARLALTAAAGRADVDRKARERERIVQTIPDPVLLIDDEGRLVSLNPAAAERFALNERFVTGTPIAGRLGSPELDALVRSPTSERAEITVDDRTYRVRVSLVDPDLGAASARVVSLQDITTENELLQLKSDFVAVMGHELRTPLTLVKGYASTLAQRGDDLPAEMRERVTSSLNTHTLRLERLIEDLLLVAGIERGRAPLSLGDGDLVEVIREQVDAARTEHPDRRFTFRAEVNALPMRFDQVKIEQVLHHLVSNAVKFSDPDDPIEVTVSAREDEGSFAVRDHGMGIYSGDIPHLFERFRQVDGTETRAHGGTGVGLYICRTLVDAHGGRIDVRSALSRGSTFTVILPRDPEEDPRGHDSESGDQPATAPGP